MSDKPICALQAPVFSRSGYGDWSMSIAKSLLRYNKYELVVVPTPWGNTPRKVNLSELDQSDAEALAVGNRILKEPLKAQPELFIQITIPSEFTPQGKYNIGMTAGIETTFPPGEWIEGANKMDLNIFTSKFSRQGFEACNFVKQYNDGRQEQLKVIKPMEVVFWGANTDIYRKTDDGQPLVADLLTSIPEKFAYLFVGQWTNLSLLYSDRKDICGLIKTFFTAFKDKSGDLPCLILKTSGVNFSQVDKEACLCKIHEIRKEVGGKLPNVYLLHGDLTDPEMNALFNHEKVKVHISFTHGEGYGHPLLLASLSGKPLLVSNWSGHLDFLNPKYTNFLDGEVKQINPNSANQWLCKESSWFNVSYSLAEEKIKSMYYNYHSGYRDNAEKLRLENMERFSVAAMDTAFHSCLDKYVPVFSVEKKIVLPSLKKVSLPKLKTT